MLVAEDSLTDLGLLIASGSLWISGVLDVIDSLGDRKPTVESVRW